MIVNYKLVDEINRDLSVRVKKNELIAANVANVDTPGYKAKDLKFDNILKNETGEIKLAVTHERHFKDTGNNDDYIVVEDTNIGRPDGNNVNIQKEMLDLTRNNIRYNIAVQFLAKELAHIKQAITMEGR